jgi:8-oxo-dGTP pyrophosphatase MutT (NUDIX family)
MVHPRGRSLDGEDPLPAAKHEFEEETGKLPSQRMVRPRYPACRYYPTWRATAWSFHRRV